MSKETEKPKEALFETRYVVIATTIYYPNWRKDHDRDNPTEEDDLRGDLTFEMVEKAKDKGCQIVIIDGGSSPDYVTELKSLGVFVSIEKEKGMSASRRQAFQEASSKEGGKVIAWMEPEKISFVDFLEKCSRSILDGEADIVVPKRTEESFKTYPSQQAQNEKRFNYWWNKALRLSGLLKKEDLDLDVSFGPKIFRIDEKLLGLFTTKYQLRQNSQLRGKVKPDIYSNATFFPVIAALKEGYHIQGVPVAYIHPKNQTAFENDHPEQYEQKRNAQKYDIVKGAIEWVRLWSNNSKKPSELMLVD